jgi:cation:H+ antiporter
MLPYILLIVGFVLLIKGADFLVDGASSIARRLEISDLVIGLTVVAFGTSTPELSVNLISSVNGNIGIAVGNVVGSNIANILLILGVSSMIYPLSVSRGTVWKEIPFSLLATVVFAIIANDALIDGAPFSAIGRGDGLVLLAFFAIFLYYSFSIARAIDGMASEIPSESRSPAGATVRMILGLGGLTLGGKWIVDGAVTVALSFGLSEAMVGLTIVAIGTSLPELATSAMAAYRRNVEIAVGNVVGSCIFNILLVLGLSSAIRPLPFERSANPDIAVLLGASLMLFISMFTLERRSVDRFEGAIFFACYVTYMAFLIIREAGAL